MLEEKSEIYKSIQLAYEEIKITGVHRKKIRIIINFSRIDQSATYHIPLFPFLKA